MARVQEFYKGRRKKKNLAIIPFIVLLALVSVTLVTFYGMQKYAVITKDGVSVELPILDDGSKQVTVDSQGNEVVSFEKVDANILCMGARVVGEGLALKIADTFLDTPFSNDERHKRRISMIED